MNKKIGLSPLSCPKPRILILGSLPSDESIKRQEYYGNRKNLFWKVIAEVYGENVPETYEEKKNLLSLHSIALWDVCAAAEREGSLDANIKDTEFNDIAGFLAKNPTIQIVVLNGGKAASEYRRYIKKNKAGYLGREEYFFTSTSALSVSAGWPLERIIEQWKAIREFESNIPMDLYPRIQGIEKVMKILGPNYDFHDSEVDDISIFNNGVVIITIWSGWVDNADGEYLMRWRLHDCVSMESCGYDPTVFWLSEMRIEPDREWIKLILGGVGPVFTCKSIDVTIRRITEKDKNNRA